MLSPGGASLVPGPALAEQDSLQIGFASAVSAFGLDVTFQSLDYCTFLSYSVLDSSNNVPLSGSVTSTNSLGGGAPAGSIFLGWTSNINDISKIVLTESDNDSTFPDNNLGYDSFRFAQPTTVPEPASGIGLLAGRAAARQSKGGVGVGKI